VGDDGDTVEGYDIVVGGGFGPNAKIGRELWKGVKAEDCPACIEALLRAYLAHRLSQQESFQAFTTRHEIDVLRALTSPLVGEVERTVGAPGEGGSATSWERPPLPSSPHPHPSGERGKEAAA
jgi:hypothetical protein